METLPDKLLVDIGGNIISAILMIGGGLFILAQNWRRDINWLFFFLTVSTFLYTIFFIMAALQTSYDAAYFWWFLNIVDVFITMAVVHFIFRVIDLHVEWRWYIISTYLVGLAIFVAAWLYPAWFLPTVEPKLYFEYYLTAGGLYTIMVCYFLLPPLVAFVNLLLVFKKSSGVQRRRFEYFILMLLVGYGVGSLNFLLVYDIQFDPIFGSLVGLYLIPIAYGIFSSDLLDIRLVVRRTFYFAFSIAGISAFLIALVLLNNFLASTVPSFQVWTIPVGVALIAYLIGRSVWKQIHETEQLKAEFITIATHKLRTPLTRIRWVIPELLARAGNDVAMRDGIRRIDDANNRLIELTNVLMEAAQPGGTFGYQKVPVDLTHLAWEAVKRFSTQISEKKIVVTVNGAQAPKALGDARRLTLVVEVMVENAVMYTPAGGTIQIYILSDSHGVRFAVTDSGIGISSEDKPRIYSSFFRTNESRTADTEGVGLGLSLAKSIIEKQNGRIGVDSPGLGKGSTFWFVVPADTE